MSLLQILAGIIITVLGVVGAATIIKWIVIKVIATNKASNRFYAVVLKGENADIELQMAIEMLDWDSGLKYVKAYAVDCGIDRKCYSECWHLCQKSTFSLVTPKEIAEILNTD